MTPYQLIILDRDGVINQDSPDYIKSADEWIPIAGSLAAIAQLNQRGYIVCICTNQSGIGRGYFSLNALEQMHAKMTRLLTAENGHIDGLFFCPHAPDEHCDCRKPKPGMYQAAIEQFSVTPEQTLVIGDSLRDIQAAQAIGVHAVLVKTGKGEKTLAAGEGLTKVTAYADLRSVVEQLL